jgi:hypothetical protein
MKVETKEFETREDLEKAYFAGQLVRGQTYHVKHINASFRLCVTRKGFVETNRDQR